MVKKQNTDGKTSKKTEKKIDTQVSKKKLETVKKNLNSKVKSCVIFYI